jgi:hypothetical protein
VVSVPTPTPTLTPVPTPEPPVSASCAKLPDGDSKASCQVEQPSFLEEVGEAIETLQVERADIFRDNNVVKVGSYYMGVIKNLDRKGLCAVFDGEELGVKRTNDFSDTYDILTARSGVRKKYLGTCAPAQFPVPAGPLPPSPPGCPLQPSREIACGREPDSRFHPDVEAAIDTLLKDKPQLFDFTDVVRGQGWPRIVDAAGYHQGIIDILVQQGYCGMFDGEEIRLKRTNDFTEHFDVNYQDVYVRKGFGIYRGNCYPAAF